MYLEVIRMDAYILMGDSNTGKTETIQRLIYKIKENGCYIHPLPRYAKSLEKLLINGLAYNPSGSMKDYSVIVEFNDRDKNIKIGITSYGDNEQYLMSKIKAFYNMKCDICVCARHKNYRKPSELDEYFVKHNIKLINITKLTVDNFTVPSMRMERQCELNQKQCDEIYSMLKSL